jgi:hypothetical protein
MSRKNRNVNWVLSLSIVAVLSIACPAAAQQAPPKQPTTKATQQPAAAQPATKAPAAKAPSAKQPAPKAAAPAQPAAKKPVDPEDAARKQAIFKTPQWRRAMFELTEWLSAQPFYNDQQVAQIKSNFNHSVAKMTSEEVNFLLNDMSAKFQIMQSKEAQDAGAWVGQYLSILSDKKREEVLKEIPDVVTMTAAQLNQEIARIERKKNAMRNNQAAFDRTRREQVNSAIEQQRFARDTYVQDQQAMPTSAGAYSPYSNSSAFQNRAALKPLNQDFGMYVGAYGGFGITLNPSSY